MSAPHKVGVLVQGRIPTEANDGRSPPFAQVPSETQATPTPVPTPAVVRTVALAPSPAEPTPASLPAPSLGVQSPEEILQSLGLMEDAAIDRMEVREPSALIAIRSPLQAALCLICHSSCTGHSNRSHASSLMTTSMNLCSTSCSLHHKLLKRLRPLRPQSRWSAHPRDERKRPPRRPQWKQRHQKRWSR